MGGSLGTIEQSAEEHHRFVPVAAVDVPSYRIRRPRSVAQGKKCSWASTMHDMRGSLFRVPIPIAHQDDRSPTPTVRNQLVAAAAKADMGETDQAHTTVAYRHHSHPRHFR